MTPEIVTFILGVVTFLLILLIAFFSLSENSFFALNKLKLDFLVKQKDKKAALINSLLREPDALLTTILVWNTIAHTVAPILFAAILILFLSREIGFTIASIVMTLMILFAGEVIPKVLAVLYPERISFLVARPIAILVYISKPIVILATKFTDLFFSIFGIKVEPRLPKITREELKHYVGLSRESGMIHSEEHKLVHAALEFYDTLVKDVIIPRDKIFAIEINTPQSTVLEMVNNCGYTRVPVFESTIDDIRGIVYTKDLLNMILYKNLFILHDLIREPFFVTEDDKVSDIFTRFKQGHQHIAIVRNKDKKTVGIITLEDIVEQLVGEILDEYD